MENILINALPYSPYDGGFTRSINHLLSSLDKQNTYRVFALIPSQQKDCQIFSSLDNIDIIERNIHSKIKYLAPYFLLDKVAKSINAALVHSDISGHYVTSCSNIITLNDLSFKIHKEESKNVLGKYYWSMLFPYSLKRATVVKVISNSTLLDAQRYYPGIDYILVWLRYDYHKTLGLGDKIRNWSTPLRILMVGNIVPRKNIGFAIRALQRIGIDYVLDIVGNPGWGYGVIRDLIEKDHRVRYWGFIEDQHLISLYRKADLYLSSSLYEGFGYPVIEALSNYCPVFLSNTSSYKDLVADEYRFDMDYDDFVFKMKGLLNTPRDLVQEKQMLVLDKFSEDKYLESHLRLYEYTITKYRALHK